MTVVYHKAYALLYSHQMNSEILQSLFLGFIITAVPGAVFIETVRRAIVDKKSVVIFLIGNVVGVTLTVGYVVVGFGALALKHQFNSAFYVLSGLVLVGIGILSIKSRPDLGKRRESRRKLSSFLTGFVLATVNPASVVFWIVMVGRFASANTDLVALLANIVSINVGAIFCYAVLIGLVARFRERLSNRHLAVLSRVSGVAIVVYGFVSLVKGLS